MPDMLSIGESMIELFSEEPMDTAETFTRSVAGDSLNIIVAASRLGTNTGYIHDVTGNGKPNLVTIDGIDRYYEYDYWIIEFDRDRVVEIAHLSQVYDIRFEDLNDDGRH